MKYAAALFDLDGTLLDTGEGVLGSVETVIANEGRPPLDAETLRTFVGPPIQKSFARVFDLDEREAKRWAAHFRDLYSTENLLKAKLYDGILDVFAQLNQRGIPIAVATYKRQDYMLKLLRHFGFDRYTSHLFGSDMAGELTKADIIAIAAESLGVAHDDALMIGDTAHDALGAQQVGMAFLAVTYGYGFKSAADTGEHPCVGVADSPMGILDYF